MNKNNMFFGLENMMKDRGPYNNVSKVIVC
jgi:hypothetical protein